MRTFTRTVSLEEAIQWLEKDRQHLVGIVDQLKAEVIKVGKRETLEALMRAKKAQNRPHWKLMTYPEIVEFYCTRTDKPAAATWAEEAQAAYVNQDPQEGHSQPLQGPPVPPAMSGHQQAPNEAQKGSNPPSLDTLSVSLIEGIVIEQLKKAVDLQNVGARHWGLSAQVAAFERSGLALLNELQASGKTDPQWMQTARMNFQTSTLALTRAVNTK